MSLPVVLRDEARDEFNEAFDFCESRQPGSGTAFARRLQEVFDRIGANPELHAIALADIRKAVVKRTSYCVYYRANATRIEVIAVLHSSRDPSLWQSRM